jgi:hypothetical protein
MFQKVVNRSYTEGFPGQMTFGGPYRAKPGRISSASGNTIGLVFGVSGEVPNGGSTQAVMELRAAVGGTTFLGILGHPQHYALNGTVSGGPLAPSIDLPQWSEGEFFDMVTGMCVAIYNETTSTKAVAYGDSLAYCTTATTALQNPQSVPVGGIISVPAGGSVPAGFQAIPNSKVRNPISLAASAAGAPVAGLTNIQLTN